MKTRECNEAEKLIIADLDECLKPSEKERLENHLRVCAPCRQVREESLALLSAIASDLPEEPGRGVLEALSPVSGCTTERARVEACLGLLVESRGRLCCSGHCASGDSCGNLPA